MSYTGEKSWHISWLSLDNCLYVKIPAEKKNGKMENYDILLIFP